MGITEEVHAAIEQHSGAVVPVLEATPPQHAAILPSEMLAFCCLCLARGVRHVLESGRRYGYSTDVLSRFDWHVTSLDTDPEKDYDTALEGRLRIELLRADGLVFVPRFVPVAPTALLLDGPKGLLALWLARRVAGRFVATAIHDAHPGSQLRAAVDGTAYLTDDPWLLFKYGHLDRASLEHRGYASHGDLLSEGNVLAILP